MTHFQIFIKLLLITCIGSAFSDKETKSDDKHGYHPQPEVYLPQHGHGPLPPPYGGCVPPPLGGYIPQPYLPPVGYPPPYEGYRPPSGAYPPHGWNYPPTHEGGYSPPKGANNKPHN